MLAKAEHSENTKASDDAKLLRAYVASGSQEAFAALVERHIDLVHACALRQCENDLHQAYDVTQIVFMALARKARGILPDAVLAGWLVRATHFTAASFRRTERRRKRREARAAELREQEMSMHSKHQEPSTAPDELWQRIAPLVDGLLARLPETARDVLVLRFLEGRSYDAIAQQLKITEETARKRAQRALASLRAALARQGIMTYEEALEGVLATAVAPATQAAMARAIASGIGQAHHHELVLKGALKLMAWSKAKVATTAVAAALLVGGGSVVVHRLINPSNERRIVELPDGARSGAIAIGQAPSASPFVLRGVVRDPSGHPVAGAKVIASYGDMRFLELSVDPQMRQSDPQAITTADGSFEVALPSQPLGAVVMGQNGAAEVDAHTLSSTVSLVTQPYGRIEGTLLFNHKPVAASSSILLSTAMLPGHGPQFQMRGRTDAAGHFSIDNVPAGRYALFFPCLDQDGEIRVAAGTSALVEIDRPLGRTIVGTLEGLKSRSSVTFLLSAKGQKPTTQPVDTFVLNSWQFDVEVSKDGSFKINHAPLGPARLSASVMSAQFLVAQKEVQIMPPQDGDTSPPLDIGTMKLGPMKS